MAFATPKPHQRFIDITLAMAGLLPKLLRNFSKLAITPQLCTPLIRAPLSTQPTAYEIVEDGEDYKTVNETIAKVNQQVAQSKQGRMFAVVHVCGKQIKVTTGDVAIIEGFWPPECGDKIQLNKILLVGAADFTIIGRPIVQKGLVNVEATVIEKTLSHTKTHFKKKRRKQYTRINFLKIPQTFIRINSIQLNGEINNPPEVHGLEKAVF